MKCQQDENFKYPDVQVASHGAGAAITRKSLSDIFFGTPCIKKLSVSAVCSSLLRLFWQLLLNMGVGGWVMLWSVWSVVVRSSDIFLFLKCIATS